MLLGQWTCTFFFTANPLSEEATTFAKAGVPNLILWQETAEGHSTEVLFDFANNQPHVAIIILLGAWLNQNFRCVNLDKSVYLGVNRMAQQIEEFVANMSLIQVLSGGNCPLTSTHSYIPPRPPKPNKIP